jgi:putative PIN family toxin of toxin-antitoxin system
MSKRIIVDTNVLISFLLLPDSLANQAVRRVLKGSIILASDDTLAELASVLARPKFNKYISLEDRQQFLRKFVCICESIIITKRIQLCRDPKDDKYLELAVNGNADLIISGDKDLLSLHPFGKVQIFSPARYLDIESTLE